MRILHLTLKKKWFDMIASGEKKEEYREIKDHWISYFLQLDKPLKLPNCTIRYDKIKSAYHFCVGYQGSRGKAISYLMGESKTVSFRQYDTVSANNGYAKDCPNIKWQHKGTRIGEGKPEWGAVPGVKYFILEIGELV